jgi:hypothetical protein
MIPMDRNDVKELHFITYIENVPSILKSGILSHNRSQAISFYDISEGGVQERRAKKKIPGTNKNLHDYANLYFDAHNPMLSARRSENDNICVLRIDKSILDIEGIIITDQNAARECWFKTVAEGLPLLNKEEIYATYWTDNDLIKQDRLKGIKCAEVLVPEIVYSDYIIGAYVASDTARSNLCKKCDIDVIINNKMFF